MKEIVMYPDAQSIALEAGQLAMSHFREVANLPVESKGHLDLVTAADKQVEQFLIDSLRREYPEDGVYGEEGSNFPGSSGRVWVVDPIDGTFNFVRGGDQWAISIGLFEGGIPRFGVLHAPVRGETYVGGEACPSTLNGERLKVRGRMDKSKAAVNVGFHPVIPVSERLKVLRFVLEEARMAFKCCGSATISLMELARGQVDGYIGMGESSWDLIAALAILEPIGVSSTIDWSATKLDTRFKFAAGTPDFLAAVEAELPFGTRLNMLNIA